VPVAIFTHPDCLRHDPGPDHPETPARLQVLLDRLRNEPAATLHDAGPADRASLLAVHREGYLRSVEALSEAGGGALFLDTILNRSSWAAALGAAGAVIAGVDHVHAGKGHAFAAVRPPGHHALASVGMGFCLVNNAVVGARHAQRLGRERVLIVDWDVHHGNGTQALVEQDETIRYVSLHQSPWYPGTGAADERGVGNVFNVPRGPGKPAELYLGDLWAAIVAATTDWTPALVLISAGFDAHWSDPLANLQLSEADFAWATRKLMDIADRRCGGRIVSLLEGGYDLQGLARSAKAHVKALMRG